MVVHITFTSNKIALKYLFNNLFYTGICISESKTEFYNATYALNNPLFYLYSDGLSCGRNLFGGTKTGEQVNENLTRPMASKWRRARDMLLPVGH